MHFYTDGKQKKAASLSTVWQTKLIYAKLQPESIWEKTFKLIEVNHASFPM